MLFLLLNFNYIGLMIHTCLPHSLFFSHNLEQVKVNFFSFDTSGTGLGRREGDGGRDGSRTDGTEGEGTGGG